MRSMKMKGKPVFKNTTKGRIQIIRQGIPIWLNPGDVVVGENYRPFLSMGLEEVGREGLPKAKAVVVNDDKPEESPVKVRKIELQDDVMPIDVVKVSSGPTPVAPPEVPVEPVEPAGEPEFVSEGEALKSEIIADLEAEMEDDELPLVILGDEDPDLGEDEEFSVEEDEDNFPFKCTECDKSFASQRGLKSHLRSH